MVEDRPDPTGVPSVIHPAREPLAHPTPTVMVPIGVRPPMESEAP